MAGEREYKYTKNQRPTEPSLMKCPYCSGPTIIVQGRKKQDQRRCTSCGKTTTTRTI